MTSPQDDLFTSCPEALCLLDAGGRFARINPAWTSLTGHTEDELVGRSHVDFIHEDDRAACAGDAFECRFARARGGFRWLAWRVGASADGGRYAAVRDVDEHRQTEQRLSVQYAVARVLAQASNLADAMARV